MNINKHYGRDISVTQDKDLFQILKDLPDHYLIENQIRRPKRFLLIFEVDEPTKTYSIYHMDRKNNKSKMELQTSDRNLVLTYLSGIKSGLTYAESLN